MTPAEELELYELQQEESRFRARDDLTWYARQAGGVEPAKHHLLLIHGLHQIEAGLIDVLLVMMPPGSAKSSYGSVIFPSWYLGRHPERCIIAASHTQELADRFGRRVRNLYSGVEHSKIFKGSGVAPDSSAMGRWDTLAGGEYFAAGIGGSITGRRADLAIIDDPVKSREDADSETVREKQWAWWRDDLMTRLKPNAGILLIMTRWHEDDLGGRVLEDLKGSGLRVRTICVPMEAMEGDELGRQPGELLWPEWYTQQMVENAKREPRTWTALYQQQPRPIGGGELKLEWLNRWQLPPRTANRVVLVDPASGKYKTRGDFTSMWVVGVGADGNEYVLDGVRDRLNLTERTEALFDLVRRWTPAAVGYEQYGLQADVEHIRGEQERQQYRFRIIELGGTTKKEDRIRRLIPGFQMGRVWMPAQLLKRTHDGRHRDVMKDFEDEYSSFPVGAHDDSIDCLARKEDEAIKRILKPPAPESKLQVIPGYRPSVPGMGI